MTASVLIEHNSNGQVATSVVLCFRNESVRLASQLEALLSQDSTTAWELVLIDNGSTDDSREIARCWLDRFGSAKLVSESQSGLARARNAGARCSSGNIVLFCDADDIVTPSWITAMTKASLDFDVFGGPLDCDALNTPAVRTWRAPLAQNSLVEAYGLRWTIGANMGCRREAFDALGGFDERFQTASDDVDFCLRAEAAGMSLGLAPEATVLYRYRDTPLGNFRQFKNYRVSLAKLYQKTEDSVTRAALAEALSVPLKELVWVIKHAPFILFNRDKRGAWSTRAGTAWGAIQGRVQQRIFRLEAAEGTPR